MGPYLPGSIVALMASVAVASVVVARKSRDAAARPLVALCAAIAIWQLGDVLLATTGSPRWQVLAALGSVALVAPLVDFVLATLRRSRGRAILLLYGVVGSFAAATAIGFASEGVHRFVVSPAFALAYGVLLLPPIGVGVVHLAHARHAEDPLVRRRARGVLVGLAFALPSGLFDLAALVVPSVPMLGGIGAAAGLVALAWTLDMGVESSVALSTRSALLVVALTAAVALLTLAVSRLTANRFEVVAATAGGTALAALAAFRLVTARLHREAMRMQSLALLGMFAAEVAHEVRNPLAAIRGAVQLLVTRAERGAAPESFAEYLRLIDREVERLDGVVTDYHALARRTSPTERASVTDVVRDVMTLHEPVLPPQVEVRTELVDGLPEVRADTGRLRQALLNLVRNAVAAMPSGGVLTLRTSVERGAGAGSTVLVDVEDTGVGIAPKDLDRIFQPLFTKREAGSGLGLAVAQRIAEEHGGALRVRSALGKGTTFTLALPTEAA